MKSHIYKLNERPCLYRGKVIGWLYVGTDGELRYSKKQSQLSWMLSLGRHPGVWT